MKNTPHSARAVTILDVAAAAQVSKSTVSLVLKGSPLIAAETAQRVRAAAARLGYVYNRRAAQLRHQSSNLVGVVINDLMNPFFAEVLAGLERRLADAGYITLMAHTSESQERQQKVLTAMREHHAAGIALCPALGTPAALTQELESWGVPLVVMVRTLGEGGYDFAGADNGHGMRLATQHLLAAGHRRIGFLGGVDGLMLEQRLDGCRAAFAEAGAAFDEGLVFTAPPTRAGGQGAMQALLAKQPALRAAVCYNDLVAFGALSALGAHGLRAGRDFALLGFDNVCDAAYASPPLSTVDVRPGELGEQAATLLLARMADPGLPRQQSLARPQLVLRQSA